MCVYVNVYVYIRERESERERGGASQHQEILYREIELSRLTHRHACLYVYEIRNSLIKSSEFKHAYVCACTCTYVRTYIHTYIHKYVRSLTTCFLTHSNCIYTYILRKIHTQTYVHIYVYVYVYIYIYIHAYTGQGGEFNIKMFKGL